MIRLVWNWLATRAASGWLIAGLLALTTVLGVVYGKWQKLQAEANLCKTTLEAEQRFNNAANLAEELIDDKAQHDIEAIKANPDACLSQPAPIPDSLRRKGN